jgi:hypothetical protein
MLHVPRGVFAAFRREPDSAAPDFSVERVQRVHEFFVVLFPFIRGNDVQEVPLPAVTRGQIKQHHSSFGVCKARMEYGFQPLLRCSDEVSCAGCGKRQRDFRCFIVERPLPVPGSADMDGNASRFQVFPPQSFARMCCVHGKRFLQIFFFCAPSPKRARRNECPPGRRGAAMIYAGYAAKLQLGMKPGYAQHFFYEVRIRIPELVGSHNVLQPKFFG